MDADLSVLSGLLHRSRHEVELIQSACQRYIDERQDYAEARSLLELLCKDSTATITGAAVNNDCNDDAGSEDVLGKRKRRN